MKQLSNRMKQGLYLLMAVLGAGAAGATLAQGNYPNKAVRLIVPFPPGGSNDIVARFLAKDLSDSLRQQFLVDNRGGASGAIGADAVAKAAPDGYTLMVHSTSHLSNAFVNTKLPYDTLKDFEPIALLAAQPSALIVSPNTPAKTVKEFIALAKSRPGQITYASNGEGGNLHVQMALFASMAGIQLIHVPYKGGAQMTTALLANETQSAVSTIGAVLGQIQAGKLPVLGVTSARRSTLLPSVPTIAESGLPGYDINAWIGAFAPVGTPRPVVDRLHSEIEKFLKKPELAKQMADQGVEPWPATQQEFAARLKTDYEQLQRVFKIIAKPAG